MPNQRNTVEQFLHPFFKLIEINFLRNLKSSYSESIGNNDQIRGNIISVPSVHELNSSFIFNPFQFIKIIHSSGIHSIFSGAFYAFRSAFGSNQGSRGYSVYSSILIELAAIVFSSVTCSGNYVAFENTLMNFGFIKEKDNLVVSSFGKFFVHFFRGTTLRNNEVLIESQTISTTFSMLFVDYLAKDLFSKDSYLYEFLPPDAVNCIFHFFLSSSKDVTSPDFNPLRIISSRDLILEFDIIKVKDALSKWFIYLNHKDTVLAKETFDMDYCFSNPSLLSTVSYTTNVVTSDGIVLPGAFLSKNNLVPTVIQVLFGKLLDVTIVTTSYNSLNVLNLYTPLSNTQVLTMKSGIPSINNIGIILGLIDSKPTLPLAQRERETNRALRTAQSNTNRTRTSSNPAPNQDPAPSASPTTRHRQNQGDTNPSEDDNLSSLSTTDLKIFNMLENIVESLLRGCTNLPQLSASLGTNTLALPG